MHTRLASNHSMAQGRFDDMYLFVVLFIVPLTVSADEQMDFDKCLKLLNGQKNCCTMKLSNKTMIYNEDIKECDLMPHIPGSCEKPMCYASKLGIATEEGTIKTDMLLKNLENELSDNKDIVEAVKEQCFDDKYQLFGEPDECDLSKMGNCIRWQAQYRCPAFKDEQPCKEIEENALKCLELLSGS